MTESLRSPQKDTAGLANSTIIDLHDLTTNPNHYDFFTLRPNLKKLILAGTAATEHISILWYTVHNGGIERHYHSMTESVYTIEGTQTDAKGVYQTGSLYFNPLGSGHAVTDSTGFFILAYTSPPDFSNTHLIEDYTPIKVDTTAPDLEKIHPFKRRQNSLWTYDIPLDPRGGMRSQLIKSTSSQPYRYQGNYLLILKGSCAINRTAFKAKTLVVATTIEPQLYDLSTDDNSFYLALGLAFQNEDANAQM